MLRDNRGLLSVGFVLVVLALVAAGCGGGEEKQTDGVEALPISSCTPIEFGGEGEPDLLLVTDFPHQGPSRARVTQIVEAIRYELEQRGWKAGAHRIGLQACDHSTPEARDWDPGKCTENADAFVTNEKVVGVIGPFNSPCAAVEIPVLNEAADGGVAMISPATTYTCLAKAAPGCEEIEPEKYYPAGDRNFTRVIGNDSVQGAALAELMKRRGVTRLFVLTDGKTYGTVVGRATGRAAEALGIRVVGFESWDPAGEAASYEALFREVGKSGADAVLLSGVVGENGVEVIKAKVGVLGSNSGKVKLYGPHGFAAQRAIDDAAGAAAGMVVSVAGVPLDALGKKGRAWAEKFAAARLAGGSTDPYAVYGAQAGRVMLDAIGKSNGTRRGVVKQLFRTKVEDGLIGTFAFDEDGDPVDATGPIVGFTVLVAGETFEPESVVVPKPETVRAAVESRPAP